MRRFLIDSDGNRYKIRVVKNPDDTIHWEIRFGRDFVGLATWTMLQADVMELNDVLIRDDYDEVGMSIIERMAQEQAKSNSKKKDFRNKGLGTELLKSLVEYALENDVKQICGSIVRLDIIRKPNLIEWYEKRGFRTGPPYPGCIKEAVAWIYRDLNHSKSERQ